MPHVQVVISVHGGYVRDVFCSIDNVEVVLVDWEVEPDDLSPDVVERRPPSFDPLVSEPSSQDRHPHRKRLSARRRHSRPKCFGHDGS
jgi:hypothetical protein